MTKIDIFSGFLGAGKTTLIKKLIQEAYAREKLVLIENEFGDIGIDGGFLQDSGINITEMNSGCICCSLVGDFSSALQKVTSEFQPDRIIIEPSGVGKLSDVIKAVQNAELDDCILNGCCTVVDAGKCKMYMKNFGEFFLDQTRHAGCIVLSHTDGISEQKLSDCLALLKAENANATIVTASWNALSGKAILSAIEQKDTLQAELDRLHDEVCHHEHHHHDENCCCGHEHHEHHHHHADEVFTSWGVETARAFKKDELSCALQALSNAEKYGTVLRAKGIVKGENVWLHFDYIPEEPDLREGSAGVIGRLCVIGCDLKEDALKELFHV